MNGLKRFGFRATSAPLLSIIYAILIVCAGCVSGYEKLQRNVRRDVYEQGDVERAKKTVEKRGERAPQKERDVLALDEASLELSSGNVVEAKRKLIRARDSFDKIEADALQKSAENLLAYWTDDNSRPYEGEDYEKVLVRAELAIADLLDNGEDAKAYATQIAAKQDDIVQKGLVDDPREQGKKINPKKNYPRVPLGPYLEGLIWEETFLDSGEAARNYEKVVEWRPQFKQGKTDLIRAQTSVHSQPNNGRVYVFAFVGRGPHKEQAYEEATQFALLIADQVFSATNRYSVPPTVAPVPVPVLAIEPSKVKSVAIDIDGKRVGASETIADVNEMALKQYEATKDQLLARAVVRRVVKKGTVYAAKQVGQVNEWINLAMDVGGVVWEATETADIRCWGLLPAEIQVASFEVPAGKRRLAFRPIDRYGNYIGVPIEVDANVEANRNAYVLVNYPDEKPLGAPVVSKFAKAN